jgi:hypothetical protein
MLLVAFFQISKTTYLSSKNSEENSRCRQWCILPTCKISTLYIWLRKNDKPEDLGDFKICTVHYFRCQILSFRKKKKISDFVIFAKPRIQSILSRDFHGGRINSI